MYFRACHDGALLGQGFVLDHRVTVSEIHVEVPVYSKLTFPILRLYRARGFCI